MTAELDLRGLEPPEPFERVLEALAGPGGRSRLVAHFDRVPWPLLRHLEQRAIPSSWVQRGDRVTVLVGDVP